MPELAAAYAVGVFASLSLTIVFYFLWSRYRDRTAARTLNENLKSVLLYWSDREDRLKSFTEEEERADRKQGAISLIATSAGLSFLSWAGFFFILILMLSYRYLARSRLEKRLFESELANEKRLPPLRVAALVSEIKKEFPC